MEKTCKTCAYFLIPRNEEGNAVGHCRRYAPRPQFMQDPDCIIDMILWPMVFMDDGCGDWELKGKKAINLKPPTLEGVRP